MGQGNVHRCPLHPPLIQADDDLTRFWMAINEKSKERKTVLGWHQRTGSWKVFQGGAISQINEMLRLSSVWSSIVCPSHQMSSWSGRRCLAECPAKLCRLLTPEQLVQTIIINHLEV